MKPRLVQSRGDLRPGMVLARGIGALQKGAVLSADEIAKLPAFGELSIVEMEPGDVHEDAAGRRLAAAVAGENVAVKPLQAGSWPLAAVKRGLLEIDAQKLAALNESDDLAVVTVMQGQIVVEDEIVGRAKIIPFVAREDEVRRAEQIGAALRVRPFVPMRVAALVQEALDDEALAKFHAALAEKVRFFGGEVIAVERVPGDLAPAIRGAVAAGAQVLVMAGSKLMDPLDPVMQGLARAGARMEKQGVPLHPGTLLWVASLDGVPIIGAPGCGLFSRPTAFDVMLARLLTGERLSRVALAQLGAGGLLTAELAFRFPPYRRGAPRGEP